MYVFINEDGTVRKRVYQPQPGEDYTDAIEVETLPNPPQVKKGQMAVMKYSTESGFYYEIWERMLDDREKLEILERTIQMTTREMVRQDQLTQEELDELSLVYPKWSGLGVAYKAGDVVAYKRNLFQVIQAHTSQPDWDPVVASSLFKNKMPEGIIPEWKQPTGSHDAFNTGDKVTFNGHVYESTIDANTWSPAEYPAGWNMIE